ncbi:hypothetical protein [Streptomyces sp. Z26]|uniref:hypothetical protein n=1 Tax=Streptomyces sp. Z26 TaxID=2500177 RepID=UPI000EF14FA3|nr:hypothetical protein [Streptomyces sp. Z26]RLL70126.1 hypothetical protein D7M15_03405 [Streptomyces sp. Z26]
MDIVLDPPHGITGFPTGMPASEVKAAAAELGRVEVQDEGSDAHFHPMKVLVLHEQFEIVFTFHDGNTLTSAEFWIPRSGDEEITVRFRGIDVFRTPALRLVEQLRGLGLGVIHREVSSWIIPGLSLGLWREAGHEVPLDVDGEPLYFQAVLVGPVNYYDNLRPREPLPG